MCLPDCSRCNIRNSNPHLLSMKHCLFQIANLLPVLYVSHGFSLEYPILPKNPVTGFACKLFSRWVEPTYSCLNHQAELGVKSGACLRHPPDAERPFSKKRKRNHLSCSISRLFPAKCSSVNTLFSCGSSFPIMLPTASISCSSDI